MRSEAQADLRLRRLYALVWTVFSAFLPFFVLWLRDRGLSPSRIGLVLAISALASVAAAPLWSHAADRRTGTVPTLRLAFVAAAVLAIGLMLTRSVFAAVAAVAAALAATQAPQTPLTDALTVTVLGPARLRDYGSFRLWSSVGWGVGAIAFGAFFQTLGLRWMLPVYAAGLMGAAVYVGRVAPSRTPLIERETGSRLGSVGEALTGVPMFALFLVGVFVFGACNRASWDFVPLRIAAGGGGPLCRPGGGRQRVRGDPVHAFERLVDGPVRRPRSVPRGRVGVPRRVARLGGAVGSRPRHRRAHRDRRRVRTDVREPRRDDEHARPAAAAQHRPDADAGCVLGVGANRRQPHRRHRVPAAGARTSIPLRGAPCLPR